MKYLFIYHWAGVVMVLRFLSFFLYNVGLWLNPRPLLWNVGPVHGHTSRYTKGNKGMTEFWKAKAYLSVCRINPLIWHYPFRVKTIALLTTAHIAVCWATAYTVKQAIEKTLLFLITSFICIETTITEEIFYLIAEPECPFSYILQQTESSYLLSY